MRLRLVALLLGALAWLPSSSSAQQRRDTIELQAGALRYAARRIGQGRVIAIDTSSVIGYTQGLPAHVFDEAIESALGPTRRGTSSELIVCARPDDYKSCALKNADVVVTLAAPRIRSDTAYVYLRLQERLDNSSWPISHVNEVLRFLRRHGAWVFSSATIHSVS